MPYLSLIVGRTTDFYLAIMASHLVVYGGFDLISVKGTTTVLAVMIQITSPSMAPTVGDFFSFGINAMCSSSVNFGSTWRFGWRGATFEEGC